MFPVTTKAEIDFDDYEPIQKLVKYKKQTFIIAEASEAVASKYRNVALKALQFEMRGGKKLSNAKMHGGAEAQIVLVSGCLFYTDRKKADGGEEFFVVKTDKQGRGVNVPEAVVQDMGSRVVKPLFELAKKISGISESDEETTNHDDAPAEGDDPKDESGTSTSS